MDQSMQSVSLALTASRSGTEGTRRARSTRSVPAVVLARLRSMRVRGMLGPSSGDHVLGETQWRSTAYG